MEKVGYRVGYTFGRVRKHLNRSSMTVKVTSSVLCSAAQIWSMLVIEHLEVSIPQSLT